jgi:membrane protein implicated in regulation of membrane protease activity
MYGIAFVVIMAAAFVVAMAVGALGGLLLALAASVAGGLVGAFLHWPDTMTWSAQLAAPLLLLAVLIVSRLLDRLARQAEFKHRRPHATD